MSQSLSTFLLVVHTLIAIALVAVILLQRSEGGALGIGSGPSGMMTARGAANLLTRATTLLAVAFIATSIGLAILASMGNRKAVVEAPPAAAAPAPLAAPDPLAADGLVLPGAPATAPAPPPATDDVPVAQ